MRRGILWIGLLLGTLAGGCAGNIVGTVMHLLPSQQKYPFLAKRFRLPHHVPSTEGGLSFRFAMVHDVLHERFSKHGDAWYESRNRTILQKFEQLLANDVNRWPLIDDFSVGLDRLGRPVEAIPYLRDKLMQQETGGISGVDLYTTFANLGTVLIHAHMGQSLRGDKDSTQLVEEGLSLIQRSIDVNPGAHFGRERWQLSIAEFIRATGEDPTLLTRFDCVGNRLDVEINRILNRDENWTDTGYGRPNIVDFTRRTTAIDEVPEFFVEGVNVVDASLWQKLSPIRNYVTRIGAEEGWEQVDVPSHRKAVPFDEPVLGIIGMWRQGGGANPHFSLALGEIMLRVGQRYIAWNAYERTVLLADRYSADSTVQDFLKQHCRNRQASIEQTLQAGAEDTGTQNGRGLTFHAPPEPVTIEQLRDAFLNDLQAGVDYQDVYQAYEEQELAKLRSTYDDQFFREFDREHDPLITKVGSEETVLTVPLDSMLEYARADTAGTMFLGCGIGAVMGSAIGQRIRRKKSETTTNKPDRVQA